MWIPKTVEDLIQSIKSYKASMTFKNLDFGAEKAAQYSAECETMADVYCNQETLFGRIEASNCAENFGQLSQEDQVKVKKEIKIQKGKTRKHEKTNEIRQSFFKAVLLGSCSGSGKLVFKHHDKMISIWSCSANTEALLFELSSGELDGEHQEFLVDSDAQEDHNSNGHVQQQPRFLGVVFVVFSYLPLPSISFPFLAT